MRHFAQEIEFNKNNERIVRIVPNGYYLLNTVTGRVFPPGSRAGWKGINIDKQNSQWSLISIAPTKPQGAVLSQPKFISSSKQFVRPTFSHLYNALTSITSPERAKFIEEALSDVIEEVIDAEFDAIESLLNIYENMEKFDPNFPSLKTLKIPVGDNNSITLDAEKFKEELENILEEGTHIQSKLFNKKNFDFSYKDLIALHSVIISFSKFLTKAAENSEVFLSASQNLQTTLENFTFFRKKGSPIYAFSAKQKLFEVNQKLKNISSIISNINMVEDLILGQVTSVSLNREFVDAIIFENIENLTKRAAFLKEKIVNIPYPNANSLDEAIKTNLIGNTFLILSDYISPAEVPLKDTVSVQFSDKKAVVSFETTTSSGEVKKYKATFFDFSEPSESIFYRLYNESHLLSDFLGIFGMLNKNQTIVKCSLDVSSYLHDKQESETKNLLINVTVNGSFVSQSNLQLIATYDVKEVTEEDFNKFENFNEEDTAYLFHLLDNLDEIYRGAKEIMKQGFFIHLIRQSSVKNFSLNLEFLSLYPVLLLTKDFYEKSQNKKETFHFFMRKCLESVFGRRYLLSDEEKDVLDKHVEIDYEDQCIKIPMPELVQLSFIHILDVYKNSMKSSLTNLGTNLNMSFIFSDEQETINEIKNIPTLNSLYFDDNNTEKTLSIFEGYIQKTLEFFRNNAAQLSDKNYIKEDDLKLIVTKDSVDEIYTMFGLSQRPSYDSLIQRLTSEINKTLALNSLLGSSMEKENKGPLFEIFFDGILEESLKTGDFYEDNFVVSKKLDKDRALIKIKSDNKNKAGFGDCRLFIFDRKTNSLYPVFMELKVTPPKVQSVFSLKESFRELLSLYHIIDTISKNLGLSDNPSEIKIKTMLPLTLGINSAVGLQSTQKKNFRVSFTKRDKSSGKIVDVEELSNLTKLYNNYVKLRGYGLFGYSLFTPEVKLGQV